ncbi:MAG: hypothetical protein HYW24_04100 [Candidatus Aenigmarchaeota archaeon]|nr:hypothetical protein [Candidatus Aenigmarchaeota archaeon]
MLEVFEDLRKYRNPIMDEYGRNDYSIANSIADKFGYRFLGISKGSSPDRDAIFLGRESIKDEEFISSVIDDWVCQGYEVYDGYVQIGGRHVNGKAITRKYGNESSIAVMERGKRASNPEKPLLVVGYTDQQIVMGLFFNTSIQHVGEIQKLAEYIGMEPFTLSEIDEPRKTEIKGTLGDFLKELDLSNL